MIIKSLFGVEIFNLNVLWGELFDEVLTEDINKAINLATDDFKPNDLIVGQGYIGAKTKEDAMDWLKIIKTALIVNFGDFKPKEESQNTYGNYSSPNSYSSQNTQNTYSSPYSSQNTYNTERKYENDEEDEDDDLEIPNAFSNLW